MERVVYTRGPTPERTAGRATCVAAPFSVDRAGVCGVVCSVRHCPDGLFHTLSVSWHPTERLCTALIGGCCGLRACVTRGLLNNLLCIEPFHCYPHTCKACQTLIVYDKTHNLFKFHFIFSATLESQQARASPQAQTETQALSLLQAFSLQLIFSHSLLSSSQPTQ